MSAADHFIESYQQGYAPWDIGKPDVNLMEVVKTVPVLPCAALEVGCGTGDNAIWLAQRGFQVTGVDLAGIAIEKARRKAAEANTPCSFLALDILTSEVEGAPFGFAFDRGCFHTMDSDEARATFARQIFQHLQEGGLWLSLIGNADEKRDSPGPPQRSAGQIVAAVEPYFEILSMVSGHFEANLEYEPRAWICLMRKRPAGV